MLTLAWAMAERKHMGRIPEEADEATRRLLEWVEASDQPPITAQTPKQARIAYEEGLTRVDFAPRDLSGIAGFEIDGGSGPLRVRLYTPSNEPDLPLLVYLHGGGFVIGSLGSHDPLCREIAARAGCMVLNVGYRLAPEHPHPAAPADARAAVTWASAHARELGADPGRLAVAGDSAGGTLAALAARHARDQDIPLRLQALLYPALDQAGSYPSRERYADVWPIERDVIRWFQRHQHGHEDPMHEIEASPGRADDLAGLAPAYILTAGLDPLQDEAIAYARRLEAAGVPVRHHHVDGTIHGFLNFGRVLPHVGPALDDLADALASAFRS